MLDYAKACQFIHQHQYPVIVGHLSPDGDAIGSAIALAMALKSLGKEPQVVMDDDLPDNLFFLPELSIIKRGNEVSQPVDSVIMTDCAAKDRGGLWLLPYLESRPSLVIDHHAVGDVTGTVELIEPKSAATAELIYQLLMALEIEITQPMAICLYAAIVSDTGGFRFNNTTPRTMRIGAELLEKGVDLQEISMNLFQRRTKKNAYLYGKVLMNLDQSADNSLSWTYLDLATVKAISADNADCANMADAPMLLPGTQIGVVFEERLGEVKLSLRARRGYDVGAVAGAIGGGGHALAAGATVKGTLNDVMTKVLDLLRQELDRRGAAS